MTDFAAKYTTARGRLFDAMKDLEWHSWKVFRAIGGVRYSARLLELRRLGFEIDDRPDPSGDGKQYRLRSTEPGDPQRKMVKIYLPETDAESLLQGNVTQRARTIVTSTLGTFRANKHKL